MAQYSYKDSLKIMLIPYLILMVLWYPLTNIILSYWRDYLIAQFLLNVIATTFIFMVCLYFENTSVYDPYWHIAPMFYVVSWAGSSNNFWVLFLCYFYCNKQNFNYFRFWPGMQYEDYRYVQIKEKFNNPFIFWTISLFGLQMMPTVMIFLGYVPTYYIMTTQLECNTFVYYFGILFTIGAIMIETIADYQLYPYRMRQVKGNCEVGLWRYSRHPNYFGECMYWWGLYIMALSYGTTYLWTAIGAIAIQALFLSFSIPNMEEHLISSRPTYASYQKRVSMFIPWFHRKND